MKRHLSTLAIALVAGAISAGAVVSLFSARADQSERVPPTSGIYTGPAWSGLVGDAFRSVSTANKGSAAPANVGGAAVDGLEWLDDSSTPYLMKRRINGGWAIEGAYDPATSSYVGVIGGGSASIASASTVDLGSKPHANITITGTTTVASFGSSAPAHAVKIIRFAGALTLTYSAALPVPCAANLVTAANDRAIVTHLGSGNWEITSYQRASGIPIDCSAVGKIEFGIFESVPSLHVAGYGQALTRSSYPALVAKWTRAQNGTRTSGNATITSVANTAGLGAGMPVEGTGIGAGCTIASVVANTSITLNSSACVTSSGTSTVTVFLTGYGTSGTSSTIGAPDCRGRTIAGRDRNDPGSYANRLTSSYFGADASIFNKTGGAESHTLTLAQLPSGITSANLAAIALAVTSSQTGVPLDATGGNALTNGSGSLNGPFKNGAIAIGAVTSSGNIAIGSAAVTSNNTSGAAHANVQPTLTAECVVRVTP